MKDKREELFNIVQKYDESLEDFVEILMYNVKMSGQMTIWRDVLKIIMLKGIRWDYLYILNMLGKVDISKEPLHHIVDLCLWHSRGSSRTSTLRDQDIFSQEQKLVDRGATWENIGNLLENFKMDMMNSMYSQLDVMREKQK